MSRLRFPPATFCKTSTSLAVSSASLAGFGRATARLEAADLLKVRRFRGVTAALERGAARLVGLRTGLVFPVGIRGAYV
jgi:hypothetical protein